MSYLHRHLEERFNPDRLLAGALSVIVVGQNYAPHEPPSDGPFKVAKYAWGQDYHRVLRRLLRRLRAQLRTQDAELKGRVCVDTAPFPDKYWAMEAGLGWQGKHTNLVSRRYGSYLVLGALIVNRQFDLYDQPHADFCGSCDACLQACPTGAFPSPYVLDARRCISYWTIESKAAELPKAIGERLGGWVFGCDECLDVCPWNRFAAPSGHPEMKRTAVVEVVESGGVPLLSDLRFDALAAGTALTRAGRAGLLRNQGAVEGG
jgi:epoxyqueuosine reductase